MPAQESSIGRLIGYRYRIISQLGAGGMGVVYRAWDTTGNVPVVIKMPKPEVLKDQDTVRRFAREIRAMASLAHPHIVPIVDDGIDAGTPFGVIRFLPGGSLSNRRLREGGASKGKALANKPSTLHLWLPAIAGALDFVHSRGVVHRDVKPDNIFFDAFWGAFLGDFGIAKVIEDSAAIQREETLTGTGMMIGTQAYMAPELFIPKSKPDGRADQYALAVIVYELLCGERPFTGESSHIMVEHCTMPAPRIDQRQSGLPASLCEAVHRGLEKRPENRFESCTEFALAVLQGVSEPTVEVGVARLLCPGCSNILKVGESARGRQGKCPKCKTELDVAEDLGALWLTDEDKNAADSRQGTDQDGRRGKGNSTITPISSTAFAPPVGGGRPLIDRSMLPLLGVGIGGGLLALLFVFWLLMSDSNARHKERFEKATAKLLAQTDAAEKKATNTAEKLAAAEKAAEKLAADKVAAEQLAAAEKVAAEKVAAEKVAATEKAAAEKAAAEKVAAAEKKKLADEAAKIPAAGDIVTNSIGMKLVAIPAGNFTMGSPAGEKDHQNNEQQVAVTITQPFLMGQTEVTQGQWKAVMGTEPWKGQSYTKEGANYPATCVSWHDATEFCAALSQKEAKTYSLPTEAQWEYACRAGTPTAFSFGANEALLSTYAWWGGIVGDGNAQNAQYAHAVATKKPNPVGLYDMHGNCWEWCSDYYADALPGGNDPKGPFAGSARVIRGGSWDNNAFSCRSASRFSLVPAFRHSSYGFRVVRLSE